MIIETTQQYIDAVSELTAIQLETEVSTAQIARVNEICNAMNVFAQSILESPDLTTVIEARISKLATPE